MINTEVKKRSSGGINILFGLTVGSKASSPIYTHTNNPDIFAFKPLNHFIYHRISITHYPARIFNIPNIQIQAQLNFNSYYKSEKRY